MSRKILGLSEELHGDLSNMSKEYGVPMTVVVESLLSKAGEIDWESVRESHRTSKPTWTNIRKSIESHLEATPGLSDEELVSLTGYSIAQVETVTLSAHKRCLAVITDSMKPKELAKKARVSEKFAKRIWEQKQGVSRIPKQEQHLWGTA